MEVIIGLGSGRCGTQTFAKMFDLPHEKYKPEELKSDVAPYYLDSIDYINERAKAKFVCLKRNKEDTVNSFVRNKVMSRNEASKYYDDYYKKAEEFDKKYSNFKIFDTEELNSPERIEEFLGKKAKKVEPVKKICPWFKKEIKEPKCKSIIKAITWRMVGTLNTVIIAWLLTGSVKISSAIGGIEVITKTILYYFHERVWNIKR
jgi:uncharacterized membrane protein